MTPLPAAERYLVALPERKGRTFTRDELFGLLTSRQLPPGVLVAPVNTNDWKRLHELFPEVKLQAQQKPSRSPQQLPGSTAFAAPIPLPEDPEPPFYGRVNRFGLLAVLLIVPGVIVLLSGMLGRSSRTIVENNSVLFTGAAILLSGIILKAIARSISTSEAALRALNYLASKQQAAPALHPADVPPVADKNQFPPARAASE
jgi:hypothetical protein